MKALWPTTNSSVLLGIVLYFTSKLFCNVPILVKSLNDNHSDLSKSTVKWGDLNLFLVYFMICNHSNYLPLIHCIQITLEITWGKFMPMDSASTAKQQDFNPPPRKIKNCLKIQTCFSSNELLLHHLLWDCWHIHDLKLWNLIRF